jgi:uncharacterized protein (TIGR00730 family)
MSFLPTKAYKNLDFLTSPPARHIRILCEYEETRQRLLEHKVYNTLVFFGSARMRSGEDARDVLRAAEKASVQSPSSADAQLALVRAQRGLVTAEYYDGARELAHRLTAWSMNRTKRPSYFISSGGGPGIMEAANRGAFDAGGRSVGLGISLPFEPGVNKYVSPELAFEFHYFFTRKYWFLYTCKAVVYFPGGFGTMDEMFETLTLVQTGKIKRKLPMVLFGTEYWDRIIKLEEMVDLGTISAEDLNLLHRTDSVDEAFDYLVAELEQAEVDGLNR